MTTTAVDWVNDLTMSADPTRTEILAFFGIPPDSEESLEANIARKRRAWNAKRRERKLAPSAERKVNGALEMIEALSQIIIDGVEDNIDFSQFDAAATALTGFTTVVELWEYVDELLADGNVNQALEAARNGVKRFGTDPDAQAALAYTVMQAAQVPTEPLEFNQLMQEGLAAANIAVTADPSPEASWGAEDAFLWQASMLINLDRPQEALSSIDEAQKRFGKLTPMLQMTRARVHADLGEEEKARTEVVAAVREAGDEDTRVKSAGAEVMIHLATKHHLPIASADDMKQYKDTIEVAAWCSYEIPEWEGMVRIHRLWARQASGRTYVGKAGRKAILSLFSGFLLAPAINRLESRPTWKLFCDGPTKCSEETWALITHQGIAFAANEDVMNELPWHQAMVAAEAGQGEPLMYGKDSKAGSRATPWLVFAAFLLFVIVIGFSPTLSLIIIFFMLGCAMTVIIPLTARLVPGGDPEVVLTGTSPEGATPVVKAAIVSAQDEYIAFPTGIFLPEEQQSGPQEKIVAKEWNDPPGLLPGQRTKTAAVIAARSGSRAGLWGLLIGAFFWLFYVLPTKFTLWLVKTMMKSKIEATIDKTTNSGEESALVKFKFKGPSARIAGASLLNALAPPLLPDRYRSPEEVEEGRKLSQGFESLRLLLIVDAVIYFVLLIPLLVMLINAQ